jgi:hypothetical protein
MHLRFPPASFDGLRVEVSLGFQSLTACWHDATTAAIPRACRTTRGRRAHANPALLPSVAAHLTPGAATDARGAGGAYVVGSHFRRNRWVADPPAGFENDHLVPQ